MNDFRLTKWMILVPGLITATIVSGTDFPYGTNDPSVEVPVTIGLFVLLILFSAPLGLLVEDWWNSNYHLNTSEPPFE